MNLFDWFAGFVFKLLVDGVIDAIGQEWACTFWSLLVLFSIDETFKPLLFF